MMQKEEKINSASKTNFEKVKKLLFSSVSVRRVCSFFSMFREQEGDVVCSFTTLYVSIC